MGSRALQCGVFPYLLNLMKSAPFTEDLVSLFVVKCDALDEERKGCKPLER